MTNKYDVDDTYLCCPFNPWQEVNPPPPDRTPQVITPLSTAIGQNRREIFVKPGTNPYS